MMSNLALAHRYQLHRCSMRTIRQKKYRLRQWEHRRTLPSPVAGKICPCTLQMWNSLAAAHDHSAEDRKQAVSDSNVPQLRTHAMAGLSCSESTSRRIHLPSFHVSLGLNQCLISCLLFIQSIESSMPMSAKNGLIQPHLNLVVPNNID
ncbi:hypothetical protein CBM2615_B140120 [Cupriavidus taiwanensis]|nr:hypothetical protein CBM2614_B150063 [Cupriavidus taiwanensis]SOZ64214.1 hypothetical protein CBM2615_B140120 [Cupriavidus taiwanensis]